MTLNDDYRYDLHVEGADPDILSQFASAFEKTPLIDYMGQDPDDPVFFSTVVVDGGGGLFRDTVEESLHSLAFQFPELKLRFTAENLDRREDGYALICQGNLFQCAEMISYMSDYTPEVPFSERKPVIQQERERAEKVEQLIDDLCNKTDFDLLNAQKEALENAVSHGNAIPQEALEGLIHFLNSVGDLGVLLGRFQYEGVEPPFPLRPDYEKREVHFSSQTEMQSNEQTYILCEEHEDEEYNHSVNILAASKNKEDLQKLMRAKIEKDEYGYIAENGISEDVEDYFSSNYNSGFVEYYIIKKDLLDRNAIDHLLSAEEYDSVFRGPENLRDAVVSAIKQYAVDNKYFGVDAQPVADALLADKAFHAYLIKEGWSSGPKISDSLLCHAIKDFEYYLDDLLNEDPNFFVKAGGLMPVSYPDNLRKIMLDCVYTVARDYHLPVNDADNTVNKILLNPEFQSVCRKSYADVTHLEDGTELYQTAVRSSYVFVQDHLLPDDSKSKRLSLSAQVQSAELKKEQPVLVDLNSNRQENLFEKPVRDDSREL